MKIVFRKENENLSMKGAFEDFVVSQMAKGISDKTLDSLERNSAVKGLSSLV